ncbi:hypothetical protein LZ31DRAFT_211382 [Colletotrichum somersetense]|nr:hypothetical protein LZ31DRAFT_211382 [Colletotrichum somersetense]
MGRHNTLAHYLPHILTQVLLHTIRAYLFLLPFFFSLSFGCPPRPPRTLGTIVGAIADASLVGDETMETGLETNNIRQVGSTSGGSGQHAPNALARQNR